MEPEARILVSTGSTMSREYSAYACTKRPSGEPFEPLKRNSTAYSAGFHAPCRIHLCHYRGEGRDGARHATLRLRNSRSRIFIALMILSKLRTRSMGRDDTSGFFLRTAELLVELSRIEEKDFARRYTRDL